MPSPPWPAPASPTSAQWSCLRHHCPSLPHSFLKNLAPLASEKQHSPPPRELLMVVPSPADSESSGISCSLPSSADVSWFKGHQPVSARTGLTVSKDGRSLRIEQAQLSDAGSYRCVASNVAGSTELQYGLRVHGELPWGHWARS